MKGGRSIFVFAKKFSKSILKEIGLFFVPNLVVERMVFCFFEPGRQAYEGRESRVDFFLVGGVFGEVVFFILISLFDFLGGQ